MFSWLPLFKEIALWILPYRHRQPELCEILRKIGFDSNLEDEDNKGRKPLTVMDPFTFFAFFMKIKNEGNRTEYFRKLKELVGLKSELPHDYNGVPSAQAMALWYFGKYEKDRGQGVMDLLWNMAEEAIKGKLNSQTFMGVLALPKVKLAKLSQGLYWLNPTLFYPIDVHKNYLEENGINAEVETLPDYLAVLEEMKKKFQKPFYEISYAAWRNNSGEDIEENGTVANEKEVQYKKKKLNMTSLNIILYGPPGTGKTYYTINKSVAIANPQFAIAASTREQLKAEYERLVKDGQIEFITFHQSMSYEDFIEGIKPVEPKEDDEFLKYEIKDGIFKRLCEKASKVPEAKQTGFSISDDEFQKASFYKMSLGDTSNPDDDQIYEWCINNGYIALGRGDANNFTGLSETDIQQMVPGQLEKFSAQALNYFIHYAKVGDYVIVSYGNLQFRAIGKITGNYEFKNVEGLQVHQFRKVEWLWTGVELPYEEIYDRQFSQQSIYKLDKRGLKKEFLVRTGNAVPVDNKIKNYVLIIDEINRGNVSQIFGELITLIEEDKRTGKEEALTATLPYSKKAFSVPPNLYIIGTMNTADRSVEALDTALRRRFSFEPMPPDTNNITESPAGINLPEMLNTINARLEALLSKDHTIGHAWLMKIDTIEKLQSAFKNKILPLLQEFFYNDYAKIGLVLGKSFVDSKPVGKQFAKFDDEMAADFADKIIYSLKDPFQLQAGDFTSIYQ